MGPFIITDPMGIAASDACAEEDWWTAQTCGDCREANSCAVGGRGADSIIASRGRTEFQPSGTVRVGGPRLESSPRTPRGVPWRARPPDYVQLDSETTPRPSPRTVPWHTAQNRPAGSDESAVAWVSGLHGQSAQPAQLPAQTQAWNARAEALHRELQEIKRLRMYDTEPRTAPPQSCAGGSSVRGDLGALAQTNDPAEPTPVKRHSVFSYSPLPRVSATTEASLQEPLLMDGECAALRVNVRT